MSTRVSTTRSPIALIGERLCLCQTAQDRSLDELHHVEGGFVDALVLAEPNHRRYRDIGRSERRDNLVLPPHVVRRAETLAQGWPSQRPALTGGVADAVSQVGVATGDALERERQLDSVHVLLEPGLDANPIDPVRRRSSPVGSACSLVAHRLASIFPTTFKA